MEPLTFPIYARVARMPISELSHGAKILYSRMRLWEASNGVCDMTHEALAEGVGVSASQVRNLLRELKKCKLIEWYNARNTNVYKVFVPEKFSKVPSRTPPQVEGKSVKTSPLPQVGTALPLLNTTPAYPPPLPPGDPRGREMCYC